MTNIYPKITREIFLTSSDLEILSSSLLRIKHSDGKYKLCLIKYNTRISKTFKQSVLKNLWEQQIIESADGIHQMAYSILMRPEEVQWQEDADQTEEADRIK